jgi:hypothetical protein
VVFALCPALLAFVALTTPLVSIAGGYDSDGIHYAAMAGARIPIAIAGHEAPFGWRVLTPWLAALLPGSFLFRFRALGLLSNWATLVLVYETLRSLHRSVSASLVGLLLYAGVFWTLKFSWYSPFYIDAQTQLFLALVTFLAVRGAFPWILAILPVAALQKESATVAGVFAVACYARRYGWHSLVTARYAALAMLGSTLPLLAVRWFVGPLPQEWSLARAFAVLLAQPSLPAKLVMSSISGLGILVVLLSVHGKHTLRFFSAHREWGLYASVTVLLTFGGVDKSRLFLYTLLPLTVAAVHVIDELHLRRERWADRTWLAATLLLHLWLGWHLTPMGDTREYLLRMVPEWAAAAGWPPVEYYTHVAVALGAWVIATVRLGWQQASTR